MKTTVIIALMMTCFSSTAMADYIDQMAYRDIANINAQERADVMHELREGDFGKPNKLSNMTKPLRMRYVGKKRCMTGLGIETSSAMVILDGKFRV